MIIKISLNALYNNNIILLINFIADFTGPVNLRGTPVFTHTNGSVTRVVIEVTWDAVEAQVQSILIYSEHC